MQHFAPFLRYPDRKGAIHMNKRLKWRIRWEEVEKLRRTVYYEDYFPKNIFR